MFFSDLASKRSPGTPKTETPFCDIACCKAACNILGACSGVLAT